MIVPFITSKKVANFDKLLDIKGKRKGATILLTIRLFL
jgi:hypothetical protein